MTGIIAQEWRRVIDLAGPLIIGYMSVNAMLTEDLAFVGHVRSLLRLLLRCHNVVDAAHRCRSGRMSWLR